MTQIEIRNDTGPEFSFVDIDTDTVVGSFEAPSSPPLSPTSINLRTVYNDFVSHSIAKCKILCKEYMVYYDGHLAISFVMEEWNAMTEEQKLRPGYRNYVSWFREYASQVKFKEAPPKTVLKVKKLKAMLKPELIALCEEQAREIQRLKLELLKNA